jgi:hypothetical protein
MRPLRPILAVVAAGALLAGTVQAATPARVSGGGFYRDGKGKNATKTMLTIEGFPASNSGKADHTVHGPGKAKTSMRITLSCVAVSGNTAYASGRDAANNEWFVKVVDNGEPGRSDQYGLSRTGETINGIPVPAQLSSTCRASQVATRAITGGGNFQVVPASS